jgi:phage FluMu gp28-like protein
MGGVWMPQGLIVSCVGTVKNCGEDLEEYDPEASYSGNFFAGLDLAQTRDFCVFSVVESINDKLFLRHLKIFSQPTKYAHVLGYIKTLQDRWGSFEKIRIDITREGPSYIADMEDAGIDNAEGVNFSLPRKSEMASLLKQRMTNQRFYYPLLSWEKPCQSDVCSELNIERFQHRKDGNISYSHPNGTHDDVFWSLALAIYGTTEMQPEPFLAVVLR